MQSPKKQRVLPRILPYLTIVAAIIYALVLIDAGNPRSEPGGYRAVFRESPLKGTARRTSIRNLRSEFSLETGAPGVPATAVIWNRNSGGVYFWESPGGTITGYLQNGEWLILKDRWESVGGVPFGAVDNAGEEVWVDMRHVHRIPRPDPRRLRQIRTDRGAYLFNRPAGTHLAWLSPGTPVLVEDVADQGGWVYVRLLIGGEAGAVPPGNISP